MHLHTCTDPSGLTDFLSGFEAIAVAVIRSLREKGRKKDDVLREIENYPISREMKLKIIDAVKKFWLDEN